MQQKHLGQSEFHCNGELWSQGRNEQKIFYRKHIEYYHKNVEFLLLVLLITC